MARIPRRFFDLTKHVETRQDESLDHDLDIERARLWAVLHIFPAGSFVGDKRYKSEAAAQNAIENERAQYDDMMMTKTRIKLRTKTNGFIGYYHNRLAAFPIPVEID